MARDRPVAMQLVAARCLTYLHRAGALSADDGKILYKTLPCLVRMCRKENRRTEKALGAETLAYLIEVDTELQRVASISDHLIQNLSLFLTNTRDTSHALAGELLDDAPNAKEVQNLKQAALRVRNCGLGCLYRISWPCFFSALFEGICVVGCQRWRYSEKDHRNGPVDGSRCHWTDGNWRSQGSVSSCSLSPFTLPLRPAASNNLSSKDFVFRWKLDEKTNNVLTTFLRIILFGSRWWSCCRMPTKIS